MPLNKKSTAQDVVDAFAPSRDLAGQVAVVTGGNSGIGIETVKALALAGCRVVLASRSTEAGRKAVEQEVRQPGLGGYTVADAEIDVKALDLSDLASVVAFANEVRSSVPRLDLLVLNAGIMALPKLERTADGFEKQIGVNHFGHALLVRLLLPIMEAQSTPSRIVTLSSTAHTMGKLSVDNLSDMSFNEQASAYSAWGAYGNSKLSNALFAQALVKRLPSDGRIASVSVHPGVIRTPLWKSTQASNPIISCLLNMFVVDKSVPQGAATTMWACLSPEVAEKGFAGKYLSDCAEGKLSARGRDAALAEALWAETDRQLDAALALRGMRPDGSALQAH